MTVPVKAGNADRFVLNLRLRDIAMTRFSEAVDVT